jgi:vancomycin permeability regulator SanA
MITILIFGAAIRPDGHPSTTLRLRVKAALAAAQGYSEGYSDVQFMPTGAVGRFGPSEASVMGRLLRESGVPPDRIVLEETGDDTLSSVRAIYRLLRERRPGGQVWVATSAYHLPRCVTLLCLLGIPARPCPPAPQPPGMIWWKRCYWWLREVPALPYDAALAPWSRWTRRL